MYQNGAPSVNQRMMDFLCSMTSRGAGNTALCYEQVPDTLPGHACPLGHIPTTPCDPSVCCPGHYGEERHMASNQTVARFWRG